MEVMETEELDRVEFQIMSPEFILKQSVCEVFSTKMNGPNSVYDERMGTIEHAKRCVQCQQNSKDCVLHHIRLLRVLGELKVRLCLSEQCLDEISLPVNLFPNKDWDVESQSSYPIFQLYFTYLCSINNNHFYNYT